LSPALDLLRKQARRVALAQSADVPSPCVSVCRMDMNTGYCEGCRRTLDEIAAWGRMPDDDKRAVWVEIANRIDEEGKT
jgi:predicted Fe-S protein YdhL (DUF1289 family)